MSEQTPYTPEHQTDGTDFDNHTQIDLRKSNLSPVEVGRALRMVDEAFIAAQPEETIVSREEQAVRYIMSAGENIEVARTHKLAA